MEDRRRQPTVRLESVPPDGGWGWLVTFGGFLNTALSHMIGTCFAIVFSRFLIDLKTSSTVVAWIYNMQSSIFNVVGLITGPLAEEFGWRKVTLIGSLFTASSLIISAFAPSAEFLFFSFGILAGIGSGATVCVSMLIVPRFFNKKRGRANSILMAGFSIGQMIGPPFTQYLQATYGFIGGTLLVGAILLHGCVAAFLFHPLEWHMKKVQIPADNGHYADEHDTDANLCAGENTDNLDKSSKLTNPQEDVLLKRAKEEIEVLDSKISGCSSGCSETEETDAVVIIQDKPSQIRTTDAKFKSCRMCNIIVKVMHTTLSHLRILRSPQAVIIAIGNTLLINGYINFIMMVPFAMQETGHSLDAAAWCISVSAICNLVSRLLVNFLHDFPWFDTKVIYKIGLAVVAVCNFVFPVTRDLQWLMAIMGLWGCGVGATMGVFSLIIIDVMGVENMTATFGATCLLIAIGYITLGPFMGYIRDLSASYGVSMCFSASLVSISLVLWLLMPLARAYDKRREERNQEERSHLNIK